MVDGMRGVHTANGVNFNSMLYEEIFSIPLTGTRAHSIDTQTFPNYLVR